MEFTEKITISLYVLDMIFIVFLFLREKKRPELTFFLFLGTSIMFVSNVPIIFYEHNIGIRDIYFGLSYNSIFKGTVINLIFIIFWQLGFFTGMKIKVAKSNTFVSERNIKFGLLFLFITFLFYARHYSQTYSYAYSKDLYAGGASLEASTYGILGSFKNLFVPTIGGLLIVFYQRKIKGNLPNVTLSKWVVRGLWFSLMFAAYVGLTKDLQRGDIVKPLLLVAVILLIQGISAKKIFFSLSLLGMVLMLISPFIDIMRVRGFYNKDVSISSVSDMLENDKALEYVNVSVNDIFSYESFLTQVARKNVLPKYSGALAQYAHREGFSFFQTFPTIVVDIIPRAFYPNKPYALSSNGTRSSTAMAISATESGNEHSVFWEVGGGTLYWQFWWVGVILGGLSVGFIWGITIKYALYGNSFLFLVMTLGAIHWGLSLIAGLDNYFLSIVRGIKPIAIFYIIKLFLFEMIFKKINNAR